jgi:glyoxylase-like metal-dependent hydrolase (beta-lactamase superfamily II)
VSHGEKFEIGGFAFEVREIPGHSPGSVVFLCQEADPAFVLGGDVLFAGSVGRTDLAYGDGPLLFAGIHSRLFSLPDETRVFPGHGPPTTIGQERRTNPFVGEGSRVYRAV